MNKYKKHTGIVIDGFSESFGAIPHKIGVDIGREIFQSKTEAFGDDIAKKLECYRVLTLKEEVRNISVWESLGYGNSRMHLPFTKKRVTSELFR